MHYLHVYSTYTCTNRKGGKSWQLIKKTRK